MEKSGRYTIKKICKGAYEVEVLQSGGGADFNKYLSGIIKNTINKKVTSIGKYAEGYKGSIELAILQRELQPDIDYEKLAASIIIEIYGDSTIETVYYINQQFIMYIDPRSGNVTRKNHSKDFICFQKMARMTAEGVITLDDIEWSD